MSQVLPAIRSRSATDSLARTVSDVLSPPILAIPAIILCSVYSGAGETAHLVLIYLVLAVGAPVLDVVRLVRSGRISDFHLPIRRERYRPFLVSVSCGLSALALMLVLGAPRDFVIPVMLMLLQTLLLFVVTLFWQISIHTATVAGLVTFAVVCCGPQALVLTLLIPLVSWSRIHLGRHTLAQTLAGSAMGIACFSTLGFPGL